MIHPLLLAYANAERAEHLAAVDATTGVRSPAMVTHRAYAAWASAGFPVEAETPAHKEPICPGCRETRALVHLADGHSFCRLCSFDFRAPYEGP